MSLEIKFTREEISRVKTDIVVILCRQIPGDEKKPGHLLKEDGGQRINRLLDGELEEIIKEELFTGELGKYKFIQTGGRIAAKNILLIGMGKTDDFTIDILRIIGKEMAAAASEISAKSITGTLQSGKIGKYKPEERIEAIAQGMVMGTYRFDLYKDKKNRDKQTLKSLFVYYDKNPNRVKEAALTGIALGEAINSARDLVNMAADDLTPSKLASEAIKISKKSGITCRVLDEKALKREKMNLLLAVSRGAKNPPRLIHIHYKPKGKAKARIAIIGKGITFDSGGYHLKPTQHIENMKSDMGGAASVLGIASLLRTIKPKVEIDAIIPAAENMIDANAIKPGDVVKSRSGKTVEIQNTDAEGRLILADAIDYAKGKKPDIIIDLATLTGHVRYSLGEIYTAILGNDQKLIDKILAVSKEAGEPSWQLPLEKEYLKGLTEGIADLNNNGKSKAGTIVGALFLAEFVDKTKWVHLDIACSSWHDEEYKYHPKGGSGAGIVTLIKFLEQI